VRSEKAVIARILGKVRVEAGLSGTLQDIVGELLVMYGAATALIASQEATGQRVYVGEMLLRNGEPSFVRWLEPLASDRETYLFNSPAEASYARRNSHKGGQGYLLLGLDNAGVEVPDESAESLERLARQHSFDHLMTVSFIFGQEWRGRIFFLDTSMTGERRKNCASSRSWYARSAPRYTTCICYVVCGCEPAPSNAPALPANCMMARSSR
jgi:hypothetical protein